MFIDTVVTPAICSPLYLSFLSLSGLYGLYVIPITFVLFFQVDDSLPWKITVALFYLLHSYNVTIPISVVYAFFYFTVHICQK